MNVSKNQLYDFPASCVGLSNGIIDVAGLLEFTGIEPVLVADVKLNGLIDTPESDSEISNKITAARQMLEEYLNVGLVQRQISVLLNNSLGGIELPYGPVGVITSVTDSDGNVLTTDNYTVEGLTFKSLLLPAQDKLTIVYLAGYQTLPRVFVEAIIAQTIYMFEHKGEEERAAMLSPDAKSMVKRYRRVFNEFFL